MLGYTTVVGWDRGGNVGEVDSKITTRTAVTLGRLLLPQIQTIRLEERNISLSADEDLSPSPHRSYWDSCDSPGTGPESRGLWVV